MYPLSVTPAIMSKRSVSPPGEQTFIFCIFIDDHYGCNYFFGETIGWKYLLHLPSLSGRQMRWGNVQIIVSVRGFLDRTSKIWLIIKLCDIVDRFEVEPIGYNETQFFPSSGRVNTIIWMHHMDADKVYGDKAWRQLHKNVASCIEQIQETTSQKKQYLYHHYHPYRKLSILDNKTCRTLLEK